MKRLAMRNRMKLVVNAGSSAETILPAASAPPQITGAMKSLIMGNFDFRRAREEDGGDCFIGFPFISQSVSTSVEDK
jgi:hypothetical protein